MDRNTSSDEMESSLLRAGWPVERHHTYFHDEVDDDEWIPEVADKGWIILTADKGVERDHLDVIIKHKAKVICLADNNSGALRWSASLIAAEDTIHGSIHAGEGPLLLRVSKSAHVRIRGIAELKEAQEKIKTRRITRAKKLGTFDYEKRNIVGQ